MHTVRTPREHVDLVFLGIAMKTYSETTNSGKDLRSNNGRHTHMEPARPTTTETRVAYDNSTWPAVNTGYINSTKNIGESVA